MMAEGVMAEGAAEDAPAFHHGAAAAAAPRRRGRPPALQKCPGRPDRKRRDRGAGTGVPKPCKKKVLSCCGYCVLHCECAPEDRDAALAAAAEAVSAARQAAHTAAATRPLRTSVPITPIGGPARPTSEIVRDETSEAADRRFNHSMTWDANGFQGQIPLSSVGATLTDVRDYFGFGRSFGDHGMGLKRKADEQLLTSERMRQGKALDQTTEAIAKIMNRAHPGEVEDIVQEWHEERAQLQTEQDQEEERALLENAVAMLDAVPNNSEAAIALRALLCKSIGNRRLRQFTTKRSVCLSTEGQKDFDRILTDGAVPERWATRKSTSDEIVQRLVRWLLSPDNVVMLSWGKRTARLDGSKIDIPCVSRKRDKSTMWREYKGQFPNKKARVGESTFYQVAKTITSKQQKSVRAVDYLIGELCHQNRGRLERLVLGTLPEEKAKPIIAEMRAIFTYVKTSFPKRVGTTDCPSHDVRWALGIDSGEPRAITDPDVRAVFSWFDKLRAEIPAQHHSIIEHAVEKLHILMGHSIRTAVQQQAIEKAWSQAKQDKTRCIILADYKMKIDPSQHRETSTEHYAKRGISYHGVCVAYINEDDEFTLRYFDTLVEGDSKQDIGATLAIVEDLLYRLREALPTHVTHFLFQSDNARNYQNLALPLMLPVLASAADWVVYRLLHSETQDGKCLVDAHFQKVNRQIDKYINEQEHWNEAQRKEVKERILGEPILQFAKKWARPAL